MTSLFAKIQRQLLLAISYVKRHFVYKMFLTYFSIFVVLLVVILIANGQQMAQRELQQGEQSGTTLLNQTSSFLQYRVQEINGIVNTIAYSDSIKQALIDGENYYSHSVANWNIQTSQGTKEIYYGSYISSDISKIRLFATNGELAFESTALFQSLDEDKQTEWRHRMENITSNYLWLPSNFFPETQNNHEILLMSRIAALDNMKRYLGYMVSTIPEATFSSIIEQATMTSSTSALLFNTYNEIIVQNSACHEDFTPETATVLARTHNIRPDDNLQEIKYLGKSYLMGIRTIDKCDWTLAILVPCDDILATSMQFMRQMIMSISIILLLSLPIIYLISRSLTARIIFLKERISSFYQEDNSESAINDSKDEISDLTDSFYKMEMNINDLMKEQYRQGFEIKDLELQVLQSQINPHFLYNTLDMMYWMGIKYNAPEISDTVTALGQFYKLSLGQGKKFVTLEDEIQHIEAYINIQNIRFHNSITFENNVPLSLYPYEMIKVTLQPLIENAINHGIREKKDETGTIFLDCCIKNENLTITIRDDGIGMTEEQLNNICIKRNHTSGHGYGVWNINERIKLTYGSQYGLNYESTLGVGTTVRLTIPARLIEL